VVERSGLYHTLFDLQNNKLVINVASPYYSSCASTLNDMNKWIKENIHAKILEKINDRN
jgi:hypothetical protein